MSIHSLAVLPAARRDLKAIDRVTLAVVDAVIMALATQPRPRGSKKLRGTESTYRVKVSTMHGPYRILYRIDDTARAVTIGRVVPRKDAY